MLDVGQYAILISGGVSLLGSLYAYQKERKILAISLLIFGALLIRLMMISLEPFLGSWDEQYHALVAKNMMQAPFTPKLYVEDFAFADSVAWSNTVIWLHKQPLFLWQMALSMKLFGTTVWALRLPSAIMGAVQCFFIYKIGKHLLHDRAGYYAAFLWTMPYFHLQQVSGWAGMDHNDVAFIFYLTASLWAWTEYWIGNRRFLFWIGIFAGCAILNKWLTGLLVYSGWGIALLADAERRRDWQAYWDMGKALIATIVVFLPWQIYISYRFPVISAHEYAYNSKHIWEALENHGGTIWFYFEKWSFYYGPGGALLSLLGVLIIALYAKNRGLLIGLATHAAVPLLFFSFIVATKMHGYGYIIVGLMHVVFGAVVYGVEELIRAQRPQWTTKLTVGLLIILAIFNFRFGDLELERIVAMKDYRINSANNVKEYQRLDEVLKEPHVIINLPPFSAPQARFFSHHLYYESLYVPNQGLEKAKAAGYPIAILRGEGGYISALAQEYIDQYDAKIVDVSIYIN